MTEQVFKECLVLMQGYFGKELSTSVAGIYWSALRGVSDESMRLGAKNLILTFVPTAQCPFPLVKHILDACGAGGISRAERVIATLRDASVKHGAYRSISFGGDTAVHRVIERYGGWPAIARWGDEDWRYRRREVLEVLQNEWSFGIGGPGHCAGICEIENGSVESVIRCPLVSDDLVSRLAVTETIAQPTGDGDASPD